MNYFRFPMLTLVLVVLGAVIPPRGATLRADVLVEIDSVRRTTSPGGFMTYYAKVTNTGAGSVAVRARRVLDQLPDTTWESSICTETHCYAVEEDLTGDQTIDPGAPRYFKIHIQAGARIGDSAVVGLRFESASLLSPIERTLTLVVVESPLPDFRVDIDAPKKVMEPREEGMIPVWIENPTAAPVTYRVRRIEAIFPDTSWHSELCVEDSCFGEATSETPLAVVQPGEYGYVRLRVTAGATNGDRARIVLRFDAGDDAKVIDRLIEVTVFSAGAGVSREPATPTAVRSPFPTPAGTYVDLPLPGAGPWRSLAIYDRNGNRIADCSSLVSGVSPGGVVRIDVTRLPSGIYNGMFAGPAGTSSSTFIVAH